MKGGGEDTLPRLETDPDCGTMIKHCHFDTNRAVDSWVCVGGMRGAVALVVGWGDRRQSNGGARVPHD